MPPTLRVHRLRRCPKCGDITVFPSHCPQLDGYTLTVGCDVVALDDLRRATLAELAELPRENAIIKHFGKGPGSWNDPEGDS